MIVVKHSGNFDKTEKFLKKMSKGDIFKSLDRYGQKGVSALAAATPRDSGKTASSWSYEVQMGSNSYSIIWSNNNTNKGVNIAVILQYGHGTRNGGFVQGRDYINPAMRPVFDQIAEEAWKEVTRS